MKVNLQDRPMYADRSQLSSTASPLRSQRPGPAALGVSSDRVNISPAATIQLSNKILETHLGKTLSAAFEKYGIDMSEAVGVDWSPEATASRIADFATGMFGIFQKQNPELSEAEVIDKFESTIRGAIDKGYAQAQEVLGSMEQNMPGNVSAIGKQTIDLVHQKLDDFFANLRNPPSPDVAA